MKKYRFETLALHAGQTPDPTTLSRAVPVYRTTAFNFKNSKHAADLFALKDSGNIYARLMNPTNDVLEKRLAALEGGAAALTFASGTAAIAFTLTNILKSGDEIVAANNLYGGTYTQLDAILPNFGIKTRFTKVNDFPSVRAAINKNTRALYIETLGNPRLDAADIEKYAEIAKEFHLPLVVDSTFATPSLVNPVEHGADIVIHSLSKWIGGHGTAIGGAVIDAGKFDWSDEKFSLYNEPDGGYHGLRFARDLGDLNNLAFILRLRTVGLRNLGATLSPDSAWIFLQGLESLPLRMERHSRNALEIAKFLAGPFASRMGALPRTRKRRFARNGKEIFQGRIRRHGRFRRKRRIRARRKNRRQHRHFQQRCQRRRRKKPDFASFKHVAFAAERSGATESGLSAELVRLSIGLENIDDLKEALDDALNA